MFGVKPYTPYTKFGVRAAHFLRGEATMDTQRAGPLNVTLDLSLPIYEQLVDHVRNAIARGEIEPGTKLPSVRDLAVQLKINPSTVVRAYMELEREGLCEKRRGQGTFITMSREKVDEVRKQLAGEALNAFIRSMKALGIRKETAKQWLEEADWS
jgi:GntR family transcriptional regulator